MTGKITRLREALRDLDEIATYIQGHGGPDRAIRFLRQAEDTFARLARQPESGAPFEPGEPRFDGLRYLPVHRFRNHLVFYRPTADGIEVLRVLHGARDLSEILGPDPDDDEAPEAG